MSKIQNQENLEQQAQIASSDLELLKDEELEAVAGEKLDDLVKHLSLRGKVAKWAAVAASVVCISSGMVMPAHAVNRARCERDTLNMVQGPNRRSVACFANAGNLDVILADVHLLFAGNNSGFVETNKGRFDFKKQEGVNFIDRVGPVTVLRIVVY